MFFSHHALLPSFKVTKRLMAIALLLLCSFSYTALAENVGILTAKVVLRKSPDKESKALQTLPEGEEVTILGTSGDWYKVNYGKYTGYVMKKYVKVSKNAVIANASKIEALGSAPAAMKVGDTGDDVTKLQKALEILGYYSGRIDGDYGAGTTNAVLAFQKDNKLEADGVAGTNTVKSIFGSVGKASTATTSTSAAASSSSSQSTAKSTSNSVSSLEAIGSAPSVTKEGDSGSNVKKLQQALELLGYYSGDIDGDYGTKTVEAVKRFQKNRGMKQDGIAGSATIRVLFGSTAEDSSTTVKKTEALDWFADNVDSLIPKNAKFTIKDVRTGKTFTAVRWSGSNHLDAEPASSQDTETMKSIYGGAWSWNRRPILIQYNGHVYAASMNGMPHGTTIISNNGFEGHFCIHFKNSKTHGTQKVDPDHQAAFNTATKASW